MLIQYIYFILHTKNEKILSKVTFYAILTKLKL